MGTEVLIILTRLFLQDISPRIVPSYVGSSLCWLYKGCCIGNLYLLDSMPSLVVIIAIFNLSWTILTCH